MKILLYISLVSCRDCSNVTSESQDIKKKNLRIHLGMEGFGVYPCAGPQPPKEGCHRYVWFTSGVDAELTVAAITRLAPFIPVEKTAVWSERKGPA